MKIIEDGNFIHTGKERGLNLSILVLSPESKEETIGRKI